MIISLDPLRDRPRRRLRGCSRLPASASNLITAVSEIAAGRIALFSRQVQPLPAARGLVSVALTRVARACLDCRRLATPPRLSSSTLALCSSDFPLANRPAIILPFTPSVFKVRACIRWCTHRDCKLLVPKGRFELPRAKAHYALNVARLPVPPLRPAQCVQIGSRPRDSNPRPAVYETAALPTELGRHATRAIARSVPNSTMLANF